MHEKLIQDLTQTAKTWLDPQALLRREALRSAAAEFCLSPASFELALKWIFSQWTAARIEANLTENPFKNKHYAAQVLAGTTPAMIAQGFFQGALLNLPQALKIPSQQTRFAELLHQSFADQSPALAALFECHTERASFYSRLKQADLVFLYGQDETIQILKTSLSKNTTLIAHGHAESAAVIFKEAAHHSSLENLAYDFLSYDQRGCLSPRAVFIEEGGKLPPALCAKIFAETLLPPFAKRYPRGGLFPGEAAAILHQRSLYGFRGTVYCGDDWTVCYNETPTWPTQALPRFLPFFPFKSKSALKKLLGPIQSHLICLGYAGSAPQFPSSIHLCPLGKMQQQLLIF